LPYGKEMTVRKFPESPALGDPRVRLDGKEQAFASMAKFEERPFALEVVKPPIIETPKAQEKEKLPIQLLQKIDETTKQKPTQSLDWNPKSPKTGIRL